MNTVEERLDQHERWIHQLAYCTSNVIAYEDDLPHEYVEDLTKIGYDEDHLRNDWTPPSLPTNPAPVVEGESMVHDLEPNPVEPNHSLNERVAKLEAMVKEIGRKTDLPSEFDKDHTHLPNGLAVTGYEPPDTDAMYSELTRIMSDLSQKVGRCEGADTAFGLRLDGLEATVKGLEKRVYEEAHLRDATQNSLEGLSKRLDIHVHATTPQPTPTEPEPGDDAKWEQVWRAHHDGGDEFLLSPVKAAVAKAVELGLVHREPVVIEVTQEDVEAGYMAWVNHLGGSSQELMRVALEAYAARLRARQEGV